MYKRRISLRLHKPIRAAVVPKQRKILDKRALWLIKNKVFY